MAAYELMDMSGEITLVLTNILVAVLGDVGLYPTPATSILLPEFSRVMDVSQRCRMECTVQWYICRLHVYCRIFV